MGEQIAGVLEGREAFTVLEGDCLEVLPLLPAESVHVVIADPPYGVNTKSDGVGKLDPWADLVNSAHFYRMWMEECRRILKPNGCLWSFMNWRSLTTFQRAACAMKWPIESLMVWDKCWIGPGGTRGLRPAYELVALFMQPEFAIENRGIPDIVRVQWSSHKPSGHPAEKPEALMDFLLRHSSRVEGEVVLDPFCGSGTTGVCAVRANRRFIGVETSPEWAAAGAGRVAACVEGGRQQLLA